MENKVKMPLWGPYSKKYMGLSKILPSLKKRGGRFDIAVHPTLWNSATPVPNVTVPSAYHLWECAPDCSYYAYRYELLWKDEVYADVSFSKMAEGAYLMRCRYHNNTDLVQNCILNIFASLEFSFTKYTEVTCSGKINIKNANDYASFGYAKERPWEYETPDGMFRGMFRDREFYLDEGLGDRCRNDHVKHLDLKPFCCEKGDFVTYNLTADGFENPVLAVRYQTVTEGDAHLDYNGTPVTLPHTDGLEIIYLPFNENPSFTSLGGAGIELDFIAVTEEGSTVETDLVSYRFVPETRAEKVGTALRTTLKYGYDGCEFNILTHNENTRFRTLESGTLEDALINRLSNGDVNYDDLKESFSASFSRKSSDNGYFHNTVIRSIFIQPHSTHTEYAVISENKLEPMTFDEYEKIYEKARAAAVSAPFNEEGKKYAFSTDVLKATLLTNTVYPVYLHGENVVHHTPGKRWDSFYTWDSGFIGMGLLEFSPELCRYALDMYLTDGTNDDFCFLLHGSLVPTQFVEFLELIKRENDKEKLRYLYKKMKLYYEFLRGRKHGSTCAKFNNGLLTTYDYWYSCSGMDDYPAQLEMMKNNAEAYSCACLPTSHIIRAGKIMKMAADYLGFTDDIAVYDADIAESERALNTLAWDEESGYFGYTMYDKDEPYIMKTADGENWDKGFDGVYPLIAGAVDKERAKRLIAHIKNPKEMWSAAGVSAVDMSASYYLNDGYWNGNVWMAHQWFVWKTMLDNGDADFAFAIADRALEMWKVETEFSYNTYECFGIETRRGGWFHNFGGLSAPICIWANAYYKPQTVTTGLDVWTDYQKTTENSAEIKFKYFGKNDRYTMIVTLADNCDYTVTLDGSEIPFTERVKGCIEITLDNTVRSGIIKVC
ncbi:MAG: hypothetical protein IJR60_00255 [Eubacterium sp.]|nr:hypothetical protein [Eubacterium sp.]